MPHGIFHQEIFADLLGKEGQERENEDEKKEDLKGGRGGKLKM